MRPKLVLALGALIGGSVALARADAARQALRRLARRADLRPQAAAPQPSRERWQCECGERYLVAGRDRHRIYWLEQAPESDPLLSHRCPACDRALPAEHEIGAVPG